MTVFKGLYKAVYDYDPLPENANEELSIKENDILYLINDEIEDGDEGWWLFKKRLVGVDVEEPIGLVPNNYIELLTEPIYKCKALYDYEELQNEEEEIAFKENDTFEVFDDSDVDWLLVKTVRDNVEDDEYGFIPSNYVEKIDGSVSSQPAPVDVNSFAPPPVRFDREQIANSQSPAPQSSVDVFQPPPKHKSLVEEKELPQLPNINDSYQKSIEDEPEDEVPPPKPMRPTTTGNTNKNPSFENEYASRSEEHLIEDFESWNVQEIVDRSTRIKAKLTIGTTLLTFYSENSPGGKPEEWSLNKLVSFDLEKKHLFLELVSPSISLELHTGNSAVGRAIYDKLCEVKGASSKSLSQIKNASTVSPQRKQELRDKKTAKVVVDFVAESSDELTITPGEKVYIINDTNSRDWTLVEKVDQPGKKGLVPSQFIQAVNQLTSIADSDEYNVRANKTKTRNYNADSDDHEIEPTKKESKTKKLLRSLTGKKSETSSNFSSNSKLKPQTTGSWKDDALQNIRSSRSASVSSKINGSQSNGSIKSPQKSSKERSYPNPKKIRSWVDRSATFKVDAELIGASQGKIHLHKTNGVKIAVPAEKLSLQDLEYVEKSTGFSLDKFKPQTSTAQEPLQAQPTDARDKERERRRRLKEREERDTREREVEELRRARELLEQERKRLREEKERDFARLKELQISSSSSPAPAKPPRPQQTGNTTKPLKNDMTGRNPNLPYYDWFEFFLKTGVDVNNCQRYTINFEREDITEDILPSIDATLLRSLGLKEGDILRVMKYLDEKFGRNQPVAPKSPEPAIEDSNWAAKPTMHTKKSVDSIQDLLDLKPAATGSQPAITPKPVAAADTSAPPTPAPLDPFKTGGGNILPMGIIPMITGGMMLQPSFTGIQPIGRMVTGGMILPVQKTGMGLVPATTFGQNNFAGSAPQLSQTTGGPMPNLTFGQQMTGGAMSMPNLSFGQPQVSMPQNTFGQQMTGGAMSIPQNTFGQQITGGAMPIPQNFGQQMTGGAMPMPQNFGQQMTGGFQPQSTFGQQMTGGFQPQSSFGITLQKTGGLAPLPQTSFGQQQMPNLAQQNNIYNNQNNQMLQQQPTGFGFGNAPQQTGGHAANLNNASVNNPFGF
ncbi:uncharacterized protein HGUI_00900 [Hanseniaspora guilliermondii]|uniref:Actin cytoskeleton-regulatory complex protein SLA1 n=1 Tax=Hanseniaspora guilliermondii TaxID=56406 RepID=A0A1L0AYT7_9ASCO|nr:uncharacterized protein HGUI_00900 [Hanseniaspora guilliermondii]